MEQKKEEKGWQFPKLTLKFTAPEGLGIDEARRVRDEELKNSLPICVDEFFNSEVDDIPREDESLDELMCVEPYELNGSFNSFVFELRKHKITEMSRGKELIRLALEDLKELYDFMKENTDKPHKVRNRILDKLEFYSQYSAVGFIPQILISWGLRWVLDICVINEESPHYDDFMTTYKWISEVAFNRMYRFAHVPIEAAFSKDDAKWVQLFGDYLYNGTDGVGKQANEAALKNIASKNPVDEVSQNRSKRGRPRSTDIPFKSLLIGTDEERERTLSLLTLQIEGKKGYAGAKVIMACVKVGKMLQPTHAQLIAQFPHIGSPQAYSEGLKHCEGADYESLLRLFQGY